jgi:hypothetical protein
LYEIDVQVVGAIWSRYMKSGGDHRDATLIERRDVLAEDPFVSLEL